mmetsp:Transcript_21861/g.35422  ORF Transcript_21861/g.35422 Transcript_21861/m.35422 type:complete len:205 (+) Transcript_21861:401-1015(+)
MQSARPCCTLASTRQVPPAAPAGTCPRFVAPVAAAIHPSLLCPRLDVCRLLRLLASPRVSSFLRPLLLLLLLQSANRCCTRLDNRRLLHLLAPLYVSLLLRLLLLLLLRVLQSAHRCCVLASTIAACWHLPYMLLLLLLLLPSIIPVLWLNTNSHTFPTYIHPLPPVRHPAVSDGRCVGHGRRSAGLHRRHLEETGGEQCHVCI